MKTLNVGKILLLCAFVIGLASCGDDVYYTMENDDKKLCDKTWIDEYEKEEGLPCTYQLRFYKDNQGQEVTTTYDAGGKVIIDRGFTWRWTDGSKEALRLTFNDGKVKYFENVWVRDHYLSGKMDGKIVMMTDASYTQN